MIPEIIRDYLFMTYYFKQIKTVEITTKINYNSAGTKKQIKTKKHVE